MPLTCHTAAGSRRREVHEVRERQDEGQDGSSNALRRGHNGIRSRCRLARPDANRFVEGLGSEVIAATLPPLILRRRVFSHAAALYT
ncbi:hypothetical protein GCM10010994_31480 [Chelatococcus reniformis]|uniref:Uncharacterized protein n=1 Tax=Chelatococcus reniformis TaxID=1494448 RepID=A0A916UG71_9HYPH|nr:hypothetical protein GCM10010994_31480 [Chelatococcus reniformis]